MSDETEFGPDHNQHRGDYANRAVLFVCLSRFQDATEALNDAKSELKDVVAQAKRVGFSRKDLDLASRLLNDEEEGDQTRREREEVIARLVGRPFTAQLDLPLEEDDANEAFTRGRIHALRGLPQLSPYSPASKDGQKWLEGFYEGCGERSRAMDALLNPPAEDDTDDGAEPESEAENELEEA